MDEAHHRVTGCTEEGIAQRLAAVFQKRLDPCIGQEGVYGAVECMDSPEILEENDEVLRGQVWQFDDWAGEVAVLASGEAVLWQAGPQGTVGVESAPLVPQGAILVNQSGRRFIDETGEALRQLGATPETTLMVGDSFARDVAGAQAIGIRAAWIAAGRRRPEGLVKPFLTVDTLAELPARLSERPDARPVAAG